jgi:NAD-dependent SIR2 family protein deacetylase
MSDETRTCKTCEKVTPLAEMSRGNEGRTRPHCRRCVNTRAKERALELHGIDGSWLENFR